jgi:hypothetical protein
MDMNWKEFAFVALATAVAIVVIEPLFESVLKSVAPSAAAKIGIV